MARKVQCHVQGSDVYKDMKITLKIIIWVMLIVANAGLMAYIQPSVLVNVLWSALFSMIVVIFLALI